MRTASTRRHGPVVAIAGGVAAVIASTVVAGTLLRDDRLPPQEQASMLCLQYRQTLNEQLVVAADDPTDPESMIFEVFLRETDLLAERLTDIRPAQEGISAYVTALRAGAGQLRLQGAAGFAASETDPFGPALDAAQAAGLNGCA